MPFVQDLSRLGRDLRRTVLVDDTPLAFLRQPDNGIPIFNFRSAPEPCPSRHWHVCLLLSAVAHACGVGDGPWVMQLEMLICCIMAVKRVLACHWSSWQEACVGEVAQDWCHLKSAGACKPPFSGVPA